MAPLRASVIPLLMAALFLSSAAFAGMTPVGAAAAGAQPSKAATPKSGSSAAGPAAGESCVSNGFLSAQVDDSNGLYSFSIGPCSDAGIVADRIVYSVGTSFITVDDFTAGTAFTEAGIAGGVTLGVPSSSVVVGSSIITTFPATTSGLMVIQNISVFGVTNSDSSILMNVRVTDSSATPQEVGIRYLWDAQVGGYDGTWLWEYDGSKPGTITGYETDFDPPPASFTSYEMGGCAQGTVAPPPYVCDPSDFGVGAGSFSVAGSISTGRGVTTPARFVYGWWAPMASSPYQYTANPHNEVGSYTPNVGGTQDSAMLYYFANETIPGGGGTMSDQADVSTTPAGIPDFSASIALAPFWGSDGTTVTVTGSNLEPLGAVSLVSFGGLGPVSLSGACRVDGAGNLSSGGCTFQVPASAPAGAYTLTFTDGTNSPTAVFIVTGPSVGATQLSIACNPSPILIGLTTRCQVVAHGANSSLPTGAVLWSSSNIGVFSKTSCVLADIGGVSTCSVGFTPTAAGSPVVITATYGGNSKNSPAIGLYGLVVSAKASNTLVKCSSGSLKVGAPSATSCTAIVSGYLPTGTVSWSQSGPGGVSYVDTSCVLSKTTYYYITYTPNLILFKEQAGVCSVTFTGSQGGQVAITANYGGDSGNKPSSGTSRVTILKAGTGISISCSSGAISVGGEEACTATVTGGYSPTGTVKWSVVLGPGKVGFSSSSCTLSEGSCSIFITGTASGTARVRAAYSGDLNNLGSSTAVAIHVSKA